MRSRCKDCLWPVSKTSKGVTCAPPGTCFMRRCVSRFPSSRYSATAAATRAGPGWPPESSGQPWRKSPRRRATPPRTSSKCGHHPFERVGDKRDVFRQIRCAPRRGLLLRAFQRFSVPCSSAAFARPSSPMAAQEKGHGRQAVAAGIGAQRDSELRSCGREPPETMLPAAHGAPFESDCPTKFFARRRLESSLSGQHVRGGPYRLEARKGCFTTPEGVASMPATCVLVASLARLVCVCITASATSTRVRSRREHIRQ